MKNTAKKIRKQQKEKQQEREVYAIGRPSLEYLSKDEQKAFYSALLFCVESYYFIKDTFPNNK